jgi:hypothetical protein
MARISCYARTAEWQTVVVVGFLWIVVGPHFVDPQHHLIPLTILHSRKREKKPAMRNEFQFQLKISFTVGTVIKKTRSEFRELIYGKTNQLTSIISCLSIKPYA